MSLLRTGMRFINSKPVVNEHIQSKVPEYDGYFHTMHRQPGIAFHEATEKRVIKNKLGALGIEFNELAGGIVATIHGRNVDSDSNKIIGLTSDMDALPMKEDAQGKPVSSEIEGVAHLCGHDGHAVSLLLATEYLHETRNFSGTARLIWRPAEETGEGAKAMLNAGLLDRYPIDEIYGFHNYPNFPLGFGAVSEGPVLCGNRDFKITIKGVDGHAGWPDVSKGQQALYKMSEFLKNQWDDARSWSSPFIRAGQNIKEGRVLLNVVGMHTNSLSPNVISSEATCMGTIRALKDEDFDLGQARLQKIWESSNSSPDVNFIFEYMGEAVPSLINAPEQTQHAIQAMKDVLGRYGKVHSMPQVTGTDDFSVLSNEVPGCYFALTGGDDDLNHPHSQKLHSAKYLFNKDLIPVAASVFARIVETRSPYISPEI